MAWATWANLLTAFRFALIPGTALAVLFTDWWVASVLFTLAVVSDVYDGSLARRFNQQTLFGGIFDHTTDALFVAACCGALAAQGLINAYLWPLILLSFTQYVFDSKVLAGQPLKASIIGRSNGIAYFVLAGTAIGAEALHFIWLMPLIAPTAWLLVVTSLISMADRALALWRLRP